MRLTITMLLILLLIPASGYAESILYHNAILSEGIPKNALAQAKNAINQRNELKITYWGDSITEGGNNELSDTYPSLIANELNENLPGVNVISNNLSLGSRNSVQAADANYVGLPTDDKTKGFSRPWSVVGKSWRDHVKDSSPDLLFIAFGVNDAGGPDSDNSVAISLKSMVDYAKTWSKVPSIVIVTPLMTTKDTNKYFERQDILQSVSRAEREYAKANNIIIADANRLFQILRDGVDEDARIHYTESDFTNFSTWWSGNLSSFSLIGTTLTPTSTNKFITRDKDFYNGKIQFDVVPAADGFNGWTWVKYRQSNDLGYMNLVIQAGVGNGVIALYNKNSPGTPIASVGSLNIPAGISTSIKLEAYGTSHKVYVNGELKLTYKSYEELHSGKVTIGGQGSIATFKNFKISYQDPIKQEPTYTEEELLGGAALGGNGMNHPSALGHAEAYFPAFNAIIRELIR